MITVNRRTYIHDAEPIEVFTALSDINSIENLLPRMRRVEVSARQQNQAHLVVHMSIGGPFGTIRCEGNLHWTEPGEVVFKVLKPLPVETRWAMSRAVNGTNVHASISLNLVPLLGPMVHFVPKEAVGDMIAKEFELALRELSLRVQHSPLRNQAVAA